MSVMASETVLVARREGCCTAYHQAVELIGKRWTGAIVFVLLEGPLRFSRSRCWCPTCPPPLFGAMNEGAGGRAIVERRVIDDMPVRVGVSPDREGRGARARGALARVWARSWL